MKLTTITLSLGLLIVLLGIIGLLSGDTQIAGGMNTDMALDITRLALGGFLIFGGLNSVDASRTALSTLAIAYLGMFILGIMSPTIYGLLPSGLGWIDQLLHVGGGLAAFFLSMNKTHTKAVA